MVGGLASMLVAPKCMGWGSSVDYIKFFHIMSKILLVIGASPLCAGLLGSSSCALGLMRPCSKTEEPAKSPAAVRWKGLAVNSAARGDRSEGVGGTSGSIVLCGMGTATKRGDSCRMGSCRRPWEA